MGQTNSTEADRKKDHDVKVQAKKDEALARCNGDYATAEAMLRAEAAGIRRELAIEVGERASLSSSRSPSRTRSAGDIYEHEDSEEAHAASSPQRSPSTRHSRSDRSRSRSPAREAYRPTRLPRTYEGRPPTAPASPASPAPPALPPMPPMPPMPSFPAFPAFPASPAGSIGSLPGPVLPPFASPKFTGVSPKWPGGPGPLFPLAQHGPPVPRWLTPPDSSTRSLSSPLPLQRPRTSSRSPQLDSSRDSTRASHYTTPPPPARDAVETAATPASPVRDTFPATEPPVAGQQLHALLEEMGTIAPLTEEVAERFLGGVPDQQLITSLAYLRDAMPRFSAMVERLPPAPSSGTSAPSVPAEVPDALRAEAIALHTSTLSLLSTVKGLLGEPSDDGTVEEDFMAFSSNEDDPCCEIRWERDGLRGLVRRLRDENNHYKWYHDPNYRRMPGILHRIPPSPGTPRPGAERSDEEDLDDGFEEDDNLLQEMEDEMSDKDFFPIGSDDSVYDYSDELAESGEDVSPGLAEAHGSVQLVSHNGFNSSDDLEAAGLDDFEDWDDIWFQDPSDLEDFSSSDDLEDAGQEDYPQAAGEDLTPVKLYQAYLSDVDESEDADFPDENDFEGFGGVDSAQAGHDHVEEPEDQQESGTPVIVSSESEGEPDPTPTPATRHSAKGAPRATNATRLPAPRRRAHTNSLEDAAPSLEFELEDDHVMSDESDPQTPTAPRLPDLIVQTRSQRRAEGLPELTFDILRLPDSPRHRKGGAGRTRGSVQKPAARKGKKGSKK